MEGAGKRGKYPPDLRERAASAAGEYWPPLSTVPDIDPTRTEVYFSHLRS
jgi:hypothetical protein